MDERLKIYIITSTEITPTLIARSEVAGADGIFNRADTDDIFAIFDQQSGKRVALIDDSPRGPKATKNYLGVIGATEVITYNDPEMAALEIPNRQPPFDTIITDLEMPQMDGLELTLKLRVESNPQSS